MNGIINFYKPPMTSSAQAVGKVKKILQAKKVGHMGTLDPMAEGVLLIGVGKATRLFDYFSGLKKTYEAKFTFGYETDTLDGLGKIVKTTTDIPSSDAALNCMRSFVGKISQVPPTYSAKHIAGARAYELARQGKEVELQPKTVEIYSATLLCQPKPDETVFEITCSSGTYIRSLARDCARRCGSLATLTYLKRVKVGDFKAENAVTLDSLAIKKDGAVIDVESCLRDLQKITVDDKYRQDLDCGRKVKADFTGDAAVYCGGALYGIGCSIDGVLKLKTYLKD